MVSGKFHSACKLLQHLKSPPVLGSPGEPIVLTELTPSADPEWNISVIVARGPPANKFHPVTWTGSPVLGY